MSEQPPHRRRATGHPLSVEDVTTIAAFARKHLPEEIQRVLDGVVVIVVADHRDPKIRNVRDDEDQALAADFLGFYDGFALEGDDDEAETPPPQGAIYINAVQHFTSDEVTRTLHHEIGHALGLSDDEVAALGLE